MAPRKPDVPCSYCRKNLSPQSDSPPTECILSNGAPCLACARQIKLAAQIEETKKLLDKLIAEEHQAQVDVNNYHDPCHRLAVEIISHIFCLTLPEFLVQSATEYWPSHEWGPSPEPWVLKLGAVCQQWRKIAWSTPRLWSIMMLNLERERTDNKIDVVREWLERSKPLPLSIRLYLAEQSGWAYDGPDRVDVASYNMQSFIKLFSDESERWEDLSLQCHQRLLDDLTKNIQSAPCLQTLQLIPRSLPGEEVWSRFAIRGPKPQPEHVMAIGFLLLQDIGVSWNNVTMVTVERLELVDCIRLLLRISPNLIHVRFEDVGSRCDLDLSKFIPQTPRTLSQLQTLYISSSIPFMPILDSIIVPSLKELKFSGPESYRHIKFSPTKVVEFLDRSLCPLNLFALEVGECNESDLIDFLYALPSSVTKVRLDINKPGINGGDLELLVLFDHLSRVSTAMDGMPSQGELLPNLKNFQYKVYKQTQISWDHLPNLLRPVSGEPRPLKRITIIQRYCDEKIPSPLLAKEQKIDKGIICDLIKLMEDGVSLFLPHRLSSQDLSAIIRGVISPLVSLVDIAYTINET